MASRNQVLRFHGNGQFDNIFDLSPFLVLLTHASLLGPGITVLNELFIRHPLCQALFSEKYCIRQYLTFLLTLAMC